MFIASTPGLNPIIIYYKSMIFLDLVASWVTGNVGHSSGPKKSARLDDDELEPR